MDTTLYVHARKYTTGVIRGLSCLIRLIRAFKMSARLQEILEMFES